jgi:hypothetical protein
MLKEVCCFRYGGHAVNMNGMGRAVRQKVREYRRFEYRIRYHIFWAICGRAPPIPEVEYWAADIDLGKGGV